MALITPFDPWRNSLCSCPAKYSLSPYTGCDHRCLYCYASSYIVRFGQVRPKKNFLARLEKEAKKLPHHATVTVANSCDPYNRAEEELKITRRMLEVLLGYDISLLIVTKSSLITRDIDILKKFRRLVIAITLTTLDPELTGKLEPHAPSPQERLAAMRTLSRHCTVICRLDPLIFPLNTSRIPRIIDRIQKAGARQIITSTYKIKPDNFKRMCTAFREHKDAWEDLYFKQGQTFGSYRYLPEKLRKELIREVKKETEGAGLLFSSCREGFIRLNTAACDGSSFFSV